MNDEWRLIDSGLCSASYNMALDEAIATSVRKGNSPPTLRLYGWNVPSVSIGCFQKVNDINIEYCNERGISLVRRPTGGRAILHENELTYSFSAKTTEGIFSKGLLDSYKKISNVFAVAFSTIGLSPESKLQRETRKPKSPLCFQTTSYGEITVNGKKIIGSAQKRWHGGLLQQGSIPCSIDRDEHAKVFRLEPPNDEIGIIGLKEVLPDLNLEELKDAIISSFEEAFEVILILSPPSQKEVSLAEELGTKKYLSTEWNFQR